MPKIVHLSSFENSVTRQVNFDRTNTGEKRQNTKIENETFYGDFQTL